MTELSRCGDHTQLTSLVPSVLTQTCPPSLQVLSPPRQDIECVEQVQTADRHVLPNAYAAWEKHMWKSAFEFALPGTIRRLRNDFVWCYKIVFGLAVLKFSDFFERRPATQTRDHAFKLYKRTSMCRSTAQLFFSDVLLMHGTNCVSLLISARYRRSCEMFTAWIPRY